MADENDSSKDRLPPNSKVTEEGDLLIDCPEDQPKVYYYTGDIKVTKDEKSSLHFTRPPYCRVDYVLAWKADDEESEKTRTAFEINLEKKGLLLEPSPTRDSVAAIEDDDSSGIRFTKIHAPLAVRKLYAEILNDRIPVTEVHVSESSRGTSRNCCKRVFWKIWEWTLHLLCITRFLTLVKLNGKVPAMPTKFTHAYDRSKPYLFERKNINREDDGDSGKRIHFFSRSFRNRIIDYILRRTKYSAEDSKSGERFGVMELLKNQTYLAAYPVHEGEWTIKRKKTEDRMLGMRQILFEHWANWKNCLRYQPLDYVRVYFGEKIGLYFACLGFYTKMLIPASILGVIVFIYGLTTIRNDDIINDVCDGKMTMCPLCDVRCPYWDISSLCYDYVIVGVLDNGSTIIFGFLMAVWGTVFLELWKREQARIQFKWHLRNLEKEQQTPRPEYLAKQEYVHEKRRLKQAQQVQEEEEKLSNTHTKEWKPSKFPLLVSFATVLFLCMVAVGVVIGVIVYRMAVQSALYLRNEELLYSNAGIVTSGTAALINLVLILILNFVYEKLAILLTDWECWRTQAEHDMSLTFKLYIMQFVNYYSSIFYIAFFKGRFAGRPGDYNTFSGARQQECHGGCLKELCVQLAIIFAGKQLIQNNLIEISSLLYKMWSTKRAIKKVNIKKAPQWLKDYFLVPLEATGLYKEYLEMVVQFGFVTFFVTAFPLAPLLALLNNIIEIRVDAFKFIALQRRPPAARGADIGFWYSIFYSVSRLAILSNAFIIAITSNYIHREVYRRGGYSPDGSLKGFLNASLAVFNVSDLPEGTEPADPGDPYHNITYCRYTDYREPPWGDHPYAYTTQHWHVVAAQFIFIVIFQNSVEICTTVLAHVIPDVPVRIKEQIRMERYLTSEIILRTERKRVHDENALLDDRELQDIRMRARVLGKFASQDQPDGSNLHKEEAHSDSKLKTYV